MTSRYGRRWAEPNHRNVDRRTVAATLLALERLFGDIPKRKTAWAGEHEAVFQNSSDAAIVPRPKGGAQ